MVRGQTSRLVVLEIWDWWLIAGNTHDIILTQNKLRLHGYIHSKTNLSTHFPNTAAKEFLQLLDNISNNPLPTSHPKNRVVNVCSINLHAQM